MAKHDPGPAPVPVDRPRHLDKAQGADKLRGMVKPLTGKFCTARWV
jgi:hypothetical protein